MKHSLFKLLRNYPQFLKPSVSLSIFFGMLAVLIFNYFFSGIIIGFLWIVIVLLAVIFFFSIGSEGSGTIFIMALIAGIILFLYTNFLIAINVFLLGIIVLPVPLLIYSLRLHKYYSIIEVLSINDAVDKYDFRLLSKALRYYREAELYEPLNEYYDCFTASKLGKNVYSLWEIVANTLASRRKIINSGIDKEICNSYMTSFIEAAEIVENITVKMAYNDIENSEKEVVETMRNQVKDIKTSLEELSTIFRQLNFSSENNGGLLESIEMCAIKTKEIKESVKVSL